jgi:hypothetical protein
VAPLSPDDVEVAMYCAEALGEYLVDQGEAIRNFRQGPAIIDIEGDPKVTIRTPFELERPRKRPQRDASPRGPSMRQIQIQEPPSPTKKGAPKKKRKKK